MIFALALLLGQDPAIDRLIRDLAHDSIEIRERAHRRLIETGEAALPSLELASRSADAELKTRAAAIVEFVRREARERPHDAGQKAALLQLRRDIQAESRPGSVAGEGARFDLSATPFKEGWIVTTRVTDYLTREAHQPGGGLVRFDVASFHDDAGNELEVDRCGRCSPGRVYVWSRGTALKARLLGEQTWFSPYPLEFKDPADGQSRTVGDFTITVAWPLLRVTTKATVCETLLSSMDLRFRCELKEGVFVPGREGRQIGRRGGARRLIAADLKDRWCDCPAGPQPMRGPTLSRGITEFFLGREPRPTMVDSSRAVLVEEDMIQLEHVSRLTCTFWKPIPIPIDLTVTVPTR